VTLPRAGCNRQCLWRPGGAGVAQRSIVGVGRGAGAPSGGGSSCSGAGAAADPIWQPRVQLPGAADCAGPRRLRSNAKRGDSPAGVGRSGCAARRCEPISTDAVPKAPRATAPPLVAPSSGMQRRSLHGRGACPPNPYGCDQASGLPPRKTARSAAGAKQQRVLGIGPRGVAGATAGRTERSRTAWHGGDIPGPRERCSARSDRRRGTLSVACQVCRRSAGGFPLASRSAPPPRRDRVTAACRTAGAPLRA